ncbi:MAG: putative catechol 2,3-dioxygenase [Conexibacter sp.]|nr:putative catechol 2,3-dioxygenase [Conexibacter sp.]
MIRHSIAQLAHVELLSAKPAETEEFFTKLLGMQVTHREGQSSYLRAYQDTYHHSIIVTEAPDAGLGHAAWRTNSPEDVDQIAESIGGTGYGTGWLEAGIGHGRAYTFTTPDGHKQEVFWDVERYVPTEDERSMVASAVQKRPLHGNPVRRIDHLNLMAADMVATSKFYQEHLSFKVREKIEMPDGDLGHWLSVSPLPHEVAIMQDMTGTPGRLHHVAMWYGDNTHLNDCAETLRDHGVFIEAGPSKHGITQSPFMYVHEPGGNRVELFGAPGYMVLEPDWEPRVWTPENLAVGGSMYGLELPATFFAYGTPNVDIDESSLTAGFRHEAPVQVPVS